MLVLIHGEGGQRLFQHLCYSVWSQARESTGTAPSVGFLRLSLCPALPVPHLV